MADQFTLQHGGSDQFLEQWGIVPQPAIPTPESTDNGKVLGVSEGQYALVSGGGGGSVEPLIVNTTETGIDASYNDLETALLAGKNIYLSFSGVYLPVMNMGYVESAEKYYASFLNPNEFGLMYVSSSDENSDMEYVIDG